MPHHILIIEDSRTQAIRLQADLGRHGLATTIATTGSGGLHAAWRDQPAAVILDLELPHLNGHAVCRLLKADARTRHIPVVVLSMHATEAVRQTSLDVGARAHLAKGPEALAGLLAVLAELELLPACAYDAG